MLFSTCNFTISNGYLTLGGEGKGRSYYNLKSPDGLNMINTGINKNLEVIQDKNGNFKLEYTNEENTPYLYLIIDTSYARTMCKNGEIHIMQFDGIETLIKCNKASGVVGLAGTYPCKLLKVPNDNKMRYIRVKFSGDSEYKIIACRNNQVAIIKEFNLADYDVPSELLQGDMLFYDYNNTPLNLIELYLNFEKGKIVTLDYIAGNPSFNNIVYHHASNDKIICYSTNDKRYHNVINNQRIGVDYVYLVFKDSQLKVILNLTNKVKRIGNLRIGDNSEILCKIERKDYNDLSNIKNYLNYFLRNSFITNLEQSPSESKSKTTKF